MRRWIKNFIRHQLGLRDIYYIQNQMPSATKKLLEDPEKLGRIKLTGLSIDSGCVVQIEGVKYVVINNVIEVMKYDK